MKEFATATPPPPLISEAERFLRRYAKVTFELGEVDTISATFKTSTDEDAAVSVRIKKEILSNSEADRRNHIEWLANKFREVELLFASTGAD